MNVLLHLKKYTVIQAMEVMLQVNSDCAAVDMAR